MHGGLIRAAGGPLRRAALWLAAGVVPAGALVGAPPPATVERASMSVEVTSAGAAVVELTYRLHVPEGTSSVPLRAVTFGGVRPDGVRISAASAALAARWERTRPPLLAGSIGLPLGARPSELRVAYRLPASGDGPGDGDLDLRIPLLLVDWPPRAAREGTFSARITLPEGYTVVERFPTVPIVETVGTGGGTAVELSLPAIPSMLRVRARRGGGGLTFAARVDVAVVLGLAVLGALGWVAYRRAGDEA